MIVSASYRTDIPAFYGRWFLNRLAAGQCRVANPYGGAPYTVALTGPSVDGYLFWTRNVGPFADALAAVHGLGIPFVVHMTVTGYPRALETAVAHPDRAVDQMRAVAARYGPRTVVWRYDPLLITDLTPPAWHRHTFARLAESLRGTVDEVCVSFANIYQKTRRNLDQATATHGFWWRDPPDDEKRALLADLVPVATEAGMAVSVCTQPDLMVPGAVAARCVDSQRLSDVAGRPLAARTKGNRPGCLCAESRDIGAYDTCPHGCVYCYAVQHRDRARRAFKAHDASAESLVTTGRPAPAHAQTALSLS